MLNAKTGKCVFRRILRVFCLLCSFIATIDKINSNKRKKYFAECYFNNSI